MLFFQHQLLGSRADAIESTGIDRERAKYDEQNHKLGLLFEVSVVDETFEASADRGHVLVCSIDLLSFLDEPAARALLHSLLQYVRSDEFEPREEIEFALLDKFV